jgi:CheY-like chemotaxis protein
MHAPILIVEDSRHDILLAERAFARANVKAPLQIVTDGEAAMQYLSGEAPFADRERFPLPSLVLLDLKLPRRNGHEVLSWIHDEPEQAHAGYPVVVLTTSDEARDRERAARSGAVAYLIKPLFQETVVEMLHSIGLDELLTA